MTETEATTSPSAPISVLSYEQPGPAQLDAQRTLWWIFCGGVAYGLMAAGANITSQASFYFLPQTVTIAHGGPGLTVLRWIYPLCHLTLAFISFGAIRRKRSTQTILTAMLTIAVIQIGISVYNIVTYPGTPRSPNTGAWMLAQTMLNLPLTVVWPTLICWEVLSSTQQDGFAVRRRLYACAAVVGLLRSLSNASQFQFIPGLVLGSPRGVSYLIAIVWNMILAALFTIAAIRRYETKSLLTAAFVIIIIGMACDLTIYWLPELWRLPVFFGSVYFSLSAASQLLSAGAAAIIVILPFVASRGKSRETLSPQF